MSIFSDNLQVIKKCKRELYNTIAESNDDGSFAISNNLSRSGHKIMTVKINDNEYRLNSAYNPIKEAQKWSLNCLQTHCFQKIILLYGLGNGYFINALLDQLGDNSKVFIYEPFESIFINAVHEYDLRDIFSKDNVSIYVGKKGFLQIKQDYCNVVGFTNIGNVDKAVLPMYDKIDKNIWENFKCSIWSYDSILKSSVRTLSKMGKEFVENELYSISHMEGCNILEDLKGIADNEYPAIIVAAGPSLEKNIGQLGKYKNRAFIIAVDTALNVMLKNDIIPDIMVSTDPHKPMSYFSDARCKNIPLVCTCDSRIELLKYHHGQKFYFDTMSFVIDFFNEIGKNTKSISKGGSVATTALMMCLELGFDKIVFVGQDLAYSSDGDTHAGDIRDSESVNNDTQLYVDGVDGDKVLSRADWIGYLTFIEDVVLRNKGVKFIDATEGGALIHGTDIMKLSEVISLYPDEEYDFSARIKEIKTSFSQRDIRKLNSMYLDILNQLEFLENEYKSIIKLGGALVDNLKNETKICNMKDEIDQFISLISQTEDVSIMSMVYNYCMKEIEEYLVNSNRDCGSIHKTQINHYECYVNIYKKILEMIPELEDIVKGNIKSETT